MSLWGLLLCVFGALIAYEASGAFLKALIDRTGPNDFYYVILGHPQDKKANKLHLKSYMTLHQRMAVMQLTVKAVSLNNDYPEPEDRHTYDTKMFETQSFADTPPGHSADTERQEFSYFGSQDVVMDYAKKNLGLQYQKPTKHEHTTDFDFLGVMAHSWFDCIPSLKMEWTECIHIIQLRNYEHFYPSELSVYELRPVFQWINADLARHLLNPTLIVFQEFDSQLQPIIQQLTEKITNYKDVPMENYNILAIVFALMESNVTISEHFCLKNRNPVPIISLGGFPSEHYVMLQFGSDKPGIKHLFELDVSGKNKTVGTELEMENKECISADSIAREREL